MSSRAPPPAEPGRAIDQGVLDGGTRFFVACSNAYAISIRDGSLHAVPVKPTPYGLILRVETRRERRGRRVRDEAHTARSPSGIQRGPRSPRNCCREQQRVEIIDGHRLADAVRVGEKDIARAIRV